MSAFNPASPERDSDLQIRALEAVRLVSAEYGIPTARLKPCIAYLLDGNITASDSKSAFTLACELRRLGFSQQEARKVLEGWAARIHWKQRDVHGPVKNAFAKNPDGSWRYYPPGLRKKPGGTYEEVLGPVCQQVGCPANCPAFSKKYQGPVAETFERFGQLGWVAYLKKRRRYRAIDVYNAICVRERQLGFAPGVELLTSYKQLAALADGIHYTSIGDSLRQLEEHGLITFIAGSGSGPHARDKTASTVQRVVPIPSPPSGALSIPPIRPGGLRRPQIGRGRAEGVGQK